MMEINGSLINILLLTTDTYKEAAMQRGILSAYNYTDIQHSP